jgi:hypothetical protein
MLTFTVAEVYFGNGFSLSGWFDGEFALKAQKYSGGSRRQTSPNAGFRCPFVIGRSA